MNRAIRKMHQRRCALKNSVNYRGGGLDVDVGAPFLSTNGVPYPENRYYSECYDQMRPGEIRAEPQVDLAQTVMAGGARRGCGCGLMRGGQGCGLMKGGQGCGLMRGGRKSRKQRGGQGCGLMKGGRKVGRKSRKQRGGSKGGVDIDPSMSIGGLGPIAEPVRLAVPCDSRAGVVDPFGHMDNQPDPRASPLFYSATANQVMPSVQAGGYQQIPNFAYNMPKDGMFTTDFAKTQAGGSYGGNAYDASCYRAPGSEMPVYPAESVGFHFTPSTGAGATLPDGVTAYNEVVQHVARLGGARRKSRKARKSAKKTKKGHRKH
jgi:hypothetical protein